jgi:hypothetical protein
MSNNMSKKFRYFVLSWRQSKSSPRSYKQYSTHERARFRAIERAKEGNVEIYIYNRRKVKFK